MTTQLDTLQAAITREIQEAVAAAQAPLAETVAGYILRGARPVPVSSSANRPTRSAAALVGFSLRETTGAATALVYLRDGCDSAGEIIAIVTLAAGESVRDWFGPGGLNVGPQGMYVHVSAGAVEGAVYLRGAD